MEFCSCKNPKPYKDGKLTDEVCANCGRWYSLKYGSMPPPPTLEEMGVKSFTRKPNKHGPCPCGSGRIYKKCCMAATKENPCQR